MKLWTEKYKPKTIKGVVGQNKPIKEAIEFLDNFKKGKALMFTGPPGTGKTLVAELLAREKQYHLITVNASDKRNAGEIESIFNETIKEMPLFSKGKIIVFDEADGLAGGDRGAVKSLIKIINNSIYPVIVIANDAYAPKLKDVRKYCKIIKFNRINVLSIAKTLSEIAKKENIKIDSETVMEIAKWSNGDMRSALLDFQMVSLGKKVVKKDDLSILGFRERLEDIFKTLSKIFFSETISVAKNAIRSSDKDPDEIFWWIETNIPKVYKNNKDLARAYEILSDADIMRNRVQKQQNWRFRLYMIDIISALSTLKPKKGFVMFQPPDRFIQMGITKVMRSEMKDLYSTVAKALHCSSNTVKEEYLPYMKIMAKKYKEISAFIHKSAK